MIPPVPAGPVPIVPDTLNRFFQAQGRVKVGPRPGTEGSEHPEEEEE
jgi:hypothetical protein